MKWKVLECEYLYKAPWLTVRKEKCLLPNGKIMEAYYTVEYPDWATAVAITSDGKMVMVRQYRHGLGVESIETPGGVVDIGESPEEAIKRELKEETGYSFDTYEYLGKVSANPATTNNYMHMYLASGGEKVAEPKYDETEDMQVLVYSLEEVKQLLKENKIVQSLHITCILYAFEKLGELKF